MIVVEVIYKDCEWMKIKIIISRFLLCTLIIFMTLLGGVVSAEESNQLEDKVSTYLGLEKDIEVIIHKSYNNEIVLWKEVKKGLIQDWGLILYKDGELSNSWRYKGPTLETFKDLYPSYHRFKDDGRKEL